MIYSYVIISASRQTSRGRRGATHDADHRHASPSRSTATALSYPWLAGFAPLNRDFSYETYAAEARRCGVTDAMHMEVDVARSRHRGRNPQRRGACARAPGIAAARRDQRVPAGGRRLSPLSSTRQRRRPVRQRLPPRPARRSRRLERRRDLSRQSSTVSPDAARPFDLCVRPDQIDKAIALADLRPTVQFVLDHCGVPAIKDRAEHPWRENIAEIAQRAQRRGQDLGRRRLRRARDLDGRGYPPLCRACDRKLRLGSRRLGQRLAGLHADRLALDLGRGDAGASRSAARRDERERLFSVNARRIWRLPG